MPETEMPFAEAREVLKQLSDAMKANQYWAYDDPRAQQDVVRAVAVALEAMDALEE